MAEQTPPTNIDLLQTLLVQEVVRVQSEVLKATGWSPMTISIEMIARAAVMVVPAVTMDDARKFAGQFWQTFADDMARKLVAMQGGASAAKPAADVLPFPHSR